MNKIVWLLVGILLLGIVTLHDHLLTDSPAQRFVYYTLSTVSVIIISYALLGSFLKIKWLIILLLLIEGSFWGYCKAIVFFNIKEFPFKYHLQDYHRTNRNYIHFDKNFAAYDPELLYTLKPNTTGKFSSMEFNTTVSTNSKGLRDDEKSLENPKILLLGDSFTMGWGLENNNVLDKHLEKAFNVPVLNTGISSYGTFREWQMTKRVNKDSLKLIVLQYFMNDMSENIEKLKQQKETGNLNTLLTQKQFEHVVNYNTLVSTYFPLKGIANHLSMALVALKTKISPEKPITKNQLPDIFSAEDHLKNFDVILNRIATENQVPILVYFIGFDSNTESVFEKKYKDSPISFLPVWSTLTSEDTRIFDDHLTEKGNEKMANKVIQKIESMNINFK